MKISYLCLILTISFFVNIFNIKFLNINICFGQINSKNYIFLLDSSKREIIYYSPTDYNSFNQVWAISQCNDKILFGTTTGIVTFQNNEWKNDINIKDSTTVRAIYTDKNGTIFIGCFNDFGYVDKNNNYQSISNKLNLNNFNDIWTVFGLNSKIYFSSFSKIFCINYSNDSNNIELLKTIETESNKVNIIQDKAYSLQHENIFEIKKTRLKLIKTIEDKYFRIILPYKRNNFLYVYQNKLIILDENKINNNIDAINNYFEVNEITKFYTFYQLDKNTFLASYCGEKNGIIILNFDNILANISLDYMVYSAFFDSYNNLWLGTINGIYRIKSKSN